MGGGGGGGAAEEEEPEILVTWAETQLSAGETLQERIEAAEPRVSWLQRLKGFSLWH